MKGYRIYPPIDGLQEYSFNTDSSDAAIKLAKHLEGLPEKPVVGRFTAVVVGGSFTGLEIATELVERLKQVAENCGQVKQVRIIIVDSHEVVSALGMQAQPIIAEVLKELKIEAINGVKVIAINQNQVFLDSGEIINSQTIIWAGGLRANPLAALFPTKKNHLGRLILDAHLKIPGVKDCFSAGDTGTAMTDDQHVSLMSCRHAMPQGRIAGYNAVADLYGKPLLRYRQEKYVTCLDLGQGGLCLTWRWLADSQNRRRLAKCGTPPRPMVFYCSHYCYWCG